VCDSFAASQVRTHVISENGSVVHLVEGGHRNLWGKESNDDLVGVG
jgi:hypothetical protein